MANILPRKLQRLLRAFNLLWGRMGSARIYAALIIGLVLVFAAIGASHIIDVWNQFGLPKFHQATATTIPPEPLVKVTTPTKTGNKAATTPSDSQLRSPTPAVPIASATPSELEREIAITDVRQTKKRGRRGETLVIATIGIASRVNVEKNALEIRISFFDLNSRNELRPTDAEVTYQWLTPDRNWSDPAPKFLVARYLQRPRRYRSFESVRYGGFLVRIYLNGKLEDERSEPEELVAMLRGGEPQGSRPEAGLDNLSGRSASNNREEPATAEKSPSMPSGPSASQSPFAEKRSSRESTVPYGKPVPGKPGFVSSPFDSKFIIDVRGFPPGTLVNDPNTNKTFRVP